MATSEAANTTAPKADIAEVPHLLLDLLALRGETVEAEALALHVQEEKDLLRGQVLEQWDEATSTQG